MQCPEGQQYSREQAREVFRVAFCDGAVIWTRHARQMMKDRNITTNDVLHLARTGVVLSTSEMDIKTGESKYRIESQNQQLKAVFTILAPRRVRILTVFSD